MQDKWRIPFTVCISILILVAAVVGYVLYGGILPAAVWLFSSWIYVGILIVFVCLPMPAKTALKITFLWLPAIWFELILDWTME
ncbi:hypothetical protein LCGC14_1035430 [marine sediment metagenome]|uniref:Uncharacterized protein n=1 Tax=marine sediment metagenome TaxID=412755 RepID=A0A0F9MTD6_9ZZZZ